MRHYFLPAALVAFVFSFLPLTANAGLIPTTEIFWTDTAGEPGNSAVWRGTQKIVSGLSAVRGLAADAQLGKVYWTEPGLMAIRRADFDGSNIETVVPDGQNGTAGVALDVAGGMMYWTDSNTGLVNGKIRRANLDGTGSEVLVTAGLVHPVGIALDTLHGKMYWTDLEGNYDGKGEIRRANLDGSNVETILTGIDEANGLAVDPVAGKVYWPDLATSTIRRANLNGTDIETLVVGQGATTVALDPSGGKLYWAGGADIWRADMDGSGPS
jgi:DNA-binding beta-propeller fold protein YncE